jgi:hypothetical protein
MHALYLHKLQITDDEYLTAVRSCIAGKLRHCLSICHQIPPCSSWYTKTQLPRTSNNSSCLLSLDFCVVTQKSRIGCRSLTHDAAASAHCHGGTLSSILKNQPPSKPQFWLLRAASRLRKRHCAVFKSKALEVVCWISVVSCAYELILLLSVVACSVRSVPRFDCRRGTHTENLAHNDRWEVACFSLGLYSYIFSARLAHTGK